MFLCFSLLVFFYSVFFIIFRCFVFFIVFLLLDVWLFSELCCCFMCLCTGVYRVLVGLIGDWYCVCFLIYFKMKLFSREVIDGYRKVLYRVIFYTDTRAGKVFDVVLLLLISLSVLSTIFDSVASIHLRYRVFFRVLEWFFTVCFSIEYFLRIYCSPNPRLYIFSFYGVIDFFSILPTYLSLFFMGTGHLSVIRLLRLLRVFRIFKLSHFVKESVFLLSAIQRSFVKIVIFMFFVLLLVTILGTVMYVVEGRVNSGFSDIPRSIYWAIVTLTTVGYGDITPITSLGQFIAASIMLLGYSIIAVPTGIISAEMVKPFYGNRQRGIVCPNCGEMEHDGNARYCKRCGGFLGG